MIGRASRSHEGGKREDKREGKSPNNCQSVFFFKPGVSSVALGAVSGLLLF